jgi:hypothetical protein
MTKEQSQNMEAPPQKRNRMWLAETGQLSINTAEFQSRIPNKSISSSQEQIVP